MATSDVAVEIAVSVEGESGNEFPEQLPQPADLERRRRWSREDWIAYALLTLEQGGIDAVRIESMARRSGRTPGSFYGYFANRDALLEAMVQDWERRKSLQLAWFHQRMKRLGTYTLSGVIEDFRTRTKGEWVRPDLEVAMRVWARHEPRARRSLQRIEELRLVHATAMVLAEWPDATHAGEVAVLLNWVLAGQHILFIDPANATLSHDAGRALDYLVSLVGAHPSLPEAASNPAPQVRKKRQLRPASR